MPMLPWPVCPLAGHATLGQNVVVGSMLVSSESRWGTYQEEVCLDPHFHCKRTIPRLAVELPLIRQFEERMIILSDTGFHAAEGDPSNLKLCPRGEWQDRMLVETVLSMLTLVCHMKKGMHRGWAYFQARLAFTMAAFNVLVQWHGFQPSASGFVPLSMAEFSL